MFHIPCPQLLFRLIAPRILKPLRTPFRQTPECDRDVAAVSAVAPVTAGEATRALRSALVVPPRKVEDVPGEKLRVVVKPPRKTRVYIRVIVPPPARLSAERPIFWGVLVGG